MAWNYENTIQQGIQATNDDVAPLGVDLQGSFLENWMYPGLQQEREFGQQVALQQMQNQWNSETEKMARAKAAGINILGAGMQIAGDSAPATGSPNSVAGAGASGVGAAAQLASAGAQSLAGAADVVDKMSTLGDRKRQIRADVVEKLEAAGLNKWQAKAIAEMLPINKDKSMAEYYQILAETDNIREEWHSIQVEREKKLHEIDKINEEKRYYTQLGALAKAQESEARANAEKLAVETWFRDQDKAFREKYGFNRDDPTKVALLSAILDGNDELAATISEVTQTDSYNIQSGIEQAELENVFDKVFDEEKAKHEVDADYARYSARIEAEKQILIEFVKSIVENPKGLYAGLAKYINQLYNIMKDTEIGDYDAGGILHGTKPPKGHPNRKRQ